MDSNQQLIENGLFDYVRKGSHGDTSKINAQTPLFKEGIFDSMGFILLVDFLEEHFGIKATDSDLIEDNFESISAITHFILRKQSTVAA
jgi:acyl carrier protein